MERGRARVRTLADDMREQAHDPQALADAYRLRVTGLSPLEGGSLNAG